MQNRRSAKGHRACFAIHNYELQIINFGFALGFGEFADCTARAIGKRPYGLCRSAFNVVGDDAYIVPHGGVLRICRV